MYLKRREVNVGTIELGKAIIPTIINIVKEKSGTGMQKHFMPIKGQISGRCPGKLSYTMSHHYSILGLDRYVVTPIHVNEYSIYF